MKKHIVLIFILFSAIQINAQFIKERAIDVSIGLGISSPYYYVDEEVDDEYSSGFYAQGEYVFTVSKWVDLRPYVGFILTQPNENKKQQNTPVYTSTTNALLIGGKVRIIAPIPIVAPYLEVGLGTSIGSFKTFTQYSNINESGFRYHIPLSFGLEIGVKHNYDFAFTYYFNPSVEQFSGAMAFGISIPLN